MQVDFLDTDPVITGSLDARYIVYQRSHLPFVQREDAVLDILGIHSVISPDDADHWNIDFREDIDRHAQSGAYAKQANQDKRCNDRIRLSEDITNDRHKSFSFRSVIVAASKRFQFARGSCTTNRQPPSARFSAFTKPPCAVQMD